VPCLEKRLYEATDFASLTPAIEKTESINTTLAIPFMLPIDPFKKEPSDPFLARLPPTFWPLAGKY